MSVSDSESSESTYSERSSDREFIVSDSEDESDRSWSSAHDPDSCIFCCPCDLCECEDADDCTDCPCCMGNPQCGVNQDNVLPSGTVRKRRKIVRFVHPDEQEIVERWLSTCVSSDASDE